ncbi:hypothetical protein PR048_025290 [Dryococelus australis]|uniref:Uncharacterized protein n=1 Tax=Dryococelus australis TaxID=614101 RepID=A0ABQ9GQW6_9NEOP|nr:hypothetical protein PR048_025290 [Dryococelus australis]
MENRNEDDRTGNRTRALPNASPTITQSVTEINYLLTPPTGAAVAERLARSPPTKANRVKSPAEFSHVGIVPDDAVGRRAFSGISRFPRPSIPTTLHIHFSWAGARTTPVDGMAAWRRWLPAVATLLLLPASTAAPDVIAPADPWQASVVYHVNVRLFRDADGDGVGDLAVLSVGASQGHFVPGRSSASPASGTRLPPDKCILWSILTCQSMTRRGQVCVQAQGGHFEHFLYSDVSLRVHERRLQLLELECARKTITNTSSTAWEATNTVGPCFNGSYLTRNCRIPRANLTRLFSHQGPNFDPQLLYSVTILYRNPSLSYHLHEGQFLGIGGDCYTPHGGREIHAQWQLMLPNKANRHSGHHFPLELPELTQPGACARTGTDSSQRLQPRAANRRNRCPPHSGLPWLAAATQTRIHLTARLNLTENLTVLYTIHHRRYHLLIGWCLHKRVNEEIWADLNSEVLRADVGDASAGVQGWGKREIPEKTRRPAASSNTIIEPGSPRWEGSSLITTPPHPPPGAFMRITLRLSKSPGLCFQWRVVKCCKVNRCLLTAVHSRCTQQEPATECIPATHKRTARDPLHKSCDVTCLTTFYWWKCKLPSNRVQHSANASLPCNEHVRGPLLKLENVLGTWDLGTLGQRAMTSEGHKKSFNAVLDPVLSTCHDIQVGPLNVDTPKISGTVADDEMRFSLSEITYGVARLLASHQGEPGYIHGGCRLRIFACGNRAGRCRLLAGASETETSRRMTWRRVGKKPTRVTGNPRPPPPFTHARTPWGSTSVHEGRASRGCDGNSLGNARWDKLGIRRHVGRCYSRRWVPNHEEGGGGNKTLEHMCCPSNRDDQQPKALSGFHNRVTRRDDLQPIRALTIATSVESIAQATNIGFDAHRRRRGIRTLTFVLPCRITDGSTVCVPGDRTSLYGKDANNTRRWRRASDATRRIASLYCENRFVRRKRRCPYRASFWPSTVTTISPRKPDDQWHHPARFLLPKIRERPGRGLNPLLPAASRAAPISDTLPIGLLRLHYRVLYPLSYCGPTISGFHNRALRRDASRRASANQSLDASIERRERRSSMAALSVSPAAGVRTPLYCKDVNNIRRWRQALDTRLRIAMLYCENRLESRLAIESQEAKYFTYHFICTSPADEQQHMKALGTVLRTYCHNSQQSWRDKIPLTDSVMIHTVNISTGFTHYDNLTSELSEIDASAYDCDVISIMKSTVRIVILDLGNMPLPLSLQNSLLSSHLTKTPHPHLNHYTISYPPSPSLRPSITHTPQTPRLFKKPSPTIIALHHPRLPLTNLAT